MKKQKTKAYWEMNVEELSEATKEFDKPLPASRMRALSKTAQAKFEKSQRSGVRSVFVSRSPTKVTLELSEDVVARSSDYASRHKMSLSEVVERSLRNALSFAE